MYPTISDLFKDLFGFGIPLPIQTFGFFVAVSVIAAAYFLSLELKRKEKEGLIKSRMQKVLKGAPVTATDILTSSIFGFIIGFKLLYIIADYSAFTANPPAYILSTEGSFIGGLIGAALSGFYKYWEVNKSRLKEKYILISS